MSGQSTPIIDPLRVRGWQKTMNKQLILESVWEQFSNRTTATTQIPNGRAMKMPTDVVHRVAEDFRPGVQFTTIPSMDKLKIKGQGGSQPVRGNEEKPKLRYSRVYYNVQRKGVTFADGSVDGDLTMAYNIADQRVNLLTDYFKELSDYNYTRSVIEGADEFLTEAEYWTGDNITSAPVGKIMHPNVFYAGQGGTAITHAGTFATDITAVRTALNTKFTTTAVNAGTYQFTKAQLDKVLKLASRFVTPLSWNQAEGGSKVKWIIMISKAQAEELGSETAAGSWYETMKDAGKRGLKNRAITGIFGYYREALIVVNERQPLFDCTVSGWDADEAVQYVKPWNDDGSSSSIYTGDNRTAAVKSGTNDTDGAGTCEICMVLGKGALGAAEVKKLQFHNEDDDYKFNKGYEARRSEGCQRLDFSITALDSFDSANLKNWSSMLFFTPTHEADLA
jgi:hypothetical protein